MHWALAHRRNLGLPLLICCLSDPAGAAEIPVEREERGRTTPVDQATPYWQPILISPEWQAVDPQRVPKMVNYYSGEELDSSGILNTIDLQYKAPGFVFKTNAVLGQPYLRGVGSDIISAGAESSVATFVDGVYLPRAFDTIVDFYDVERVEVIKGPQGVHLGRNVVGGAVSIHTKDPEPYRTGYADVLLGNYDQRQLRGAVNVPINGPELVFRLAGTMAKRDGYTENIFLRQDADDEDYYALRAKLLYTPRENLSLLFSAERHDEDSSRAIGPHVDPDNGVNGGITFGGIVPGDPREITSNVAPKVDVRSSRYSARLTWDNDVFELLSTTAYLKTEGALALDLDGTNVDYSANFPSADSETVSQEFRLSSPVEQPFSWIGGLYFLLENTDQVLDVRLPLAGIRNAPDGQVDTRSYAAFGQLAWRFQPDWRAKAGLRYSRDTRKLDLIKTVSSPAGTAVSTQFEHENWHAFTPEIGLEYSPDRNRLYYATIARGYKPGGFNTSTIQPAFDSEFLWAYEAGIKRTFPQRRLRTNAALFYYDYEDMQLNTPPSGAPVGTFPIVINAAKASVRGAEIDVLFQPRWNLDLSLAVTLLDAQFEDFDSVDPNNPTDDPDRTGNALPQAPEVSLSLGAAHRWPIEGGTLRLSGEYRYQSEVYFSIYEDPVVRQGGYGLVNAGLVYENHKGDWYAELYGRNLTDQLYTQTVNRNDTSGGLTGVKRFWGAPRTLGLRIGYRW